MRNLSVILALFVAAAWADVPWQWEAWSQGTQRHLLGDRFTPGSSPYPKQTCPKYLSDSCKHFLDVWKTAEIWDAITASLKACRRAQGQGLNPVASAGFAAVCHMAATSAALANKDTAAVDLSVKQVSSIVIDFDVSLTKSLTIATHGLGSSLQQMVKTEGKATQAVRASNLAVEALSSLTVITFSEGLSGAAAHYGQALQDARNCISAFQSGHRDLGCPAQVTGRAQYNYGA